MKPERRGTLVAKMTARVVGWVVIAIAVLIYLWIAMLFATDYTFANTLAGTFWYQKAPDQPNLVQAIVQRYLWPELWDDVIVPVLLWPAWRALIVGNGFIAAFGIILVLIGMERKPGRRTFIEWLLRKPIPRPERSPL